MDCFRSLLCGVLLFQVVLVHSAPVYKRWIPSYADNDYGDHSYSQDGSSGQPNYMSYWSDFYPGGYSGGGGDYNDAMQFYRAGGSGGQPESTYATMDPVQQLKNVQAYSYAQTLRQQYPYAPPFPYPPPPQAYGAYPSADNPAGRSGFSGLQLGVLELGGLFGGQSTASQPQPQPQRQQFTEQQPIILEVQQKQKPQSQPVSIFLTPEVLEFLKQSNSLAGKGLFDREDKRQKAQSTKGHTKEAQTEESQDKQEKIKEHIKESQTQEHIKETKQTHESHPQEQEKTEQHTEEHQKPQKTHESHAQEKEKTEQQTEEHQKPQNHEKTEHSTEEHQKPQQTHKTEEAIKDTQETHEHQSQENKPQTGHKVLAVVKVTEKEVTETHSSSTKGNTHSKPQKEQVKETEEKIEKTEQATEEKEDKKVVKGRTYDVPSSEDSVSSASPLDLVYPATAVPSRPTIPSYYQYPQQSLPSYSVPQSSSPYYANPYTSSQMSSYATGAAALPYYSGYPNYAGYYQSPARASRSPVAVAATPVFVRYVYGYPPQQFV